MRENMEEKQVQVSMIMKLKGFVLLLLISSCDPVPPFEEIPWIPFDDIEINLNLPQYSALRVDGGLQTINGGVRGIIIYRESASVFHAFERNCSWFPNDACATVDIDQSNLFLFDTCCGSVFSLPNGIPNGGPAVYPLRKYLVSVNGNLLTITDDVIN